jgi:hypothetical protein
VSIEYLSIEERIPARQPRRPIRKLADQALDRLNPTFGKLYAAEGRPSVPPDQLPLASLLQAFYGIRSERLLLEQLHDNVLFRWFVGLSPDDPIWHPTPFSNIASGSSMTTSWGACWRSSAGGPHPKPKPHIRSSVGMPSSPRPSFRVSALSRQRARRERRAGSSALSTGTWS